MYTMEYYSPATNETITLYGGKWMEFGVSMMITTRQSLMCSNVESGLTMNMMMTLK
jgi:hypothetical protein